MRITPSLAKALRSEPYKGIWEARNPESLRDIRRNLAQQIKKLSNAYNRIEEKPIGSIFQDSGSAANLREAYLQYFMPLNAMRAAAIWQELERSGWRYGPQDTWRALDIGSGPGSSLLGVALAESLTPVGLPKKGEIALIDQNRALLSDARSIRRAFLEASGLNWSENEFVRKIDFSQTFLPRNAPVFDLITMSFVLNELETPTDLLAKNITGLMDRHLSTEGLLVIIEPALKLQNRKLLELRQALIKQSRYQLLLPCLGHQVCGALTHAQDFCHEELLWDRTDWIRTLDQMTGLDQRRLCFGYLVFTKSNRSISELLPRLEGRTTRVLSDPIRQGQKQRFFVCDACEKRQIYTDRPRGNKAMSEATQKGDFLKLTKE